MSSCKKDSCEKDSCEKDSCKKVDDTLGRHYNSSLYPCNHLNNTTLITKTQVILIFV